jgi:hypothetical protein
MPQQLGQQFDNIGPDQDLMVIGAELFGYLSRVG